MDLVIVVIAFFIAVVLVEAIWSKREEKKAEREREREREERKYHDLTGWRKESESTETEATKTKVEAEPTMIQTVTFADGSEKEVAVRPCEVKETYTLSELVPIVGVTHRTLVKYVNEGKLRATKIDRVWRVKESDLNEFMNGRKTK